ncbi:hypothetical protein GCM10027416_21090 [Okibacterium endophyticum]
MANATEQLLDLARRVCERLVACEEREASTGDLAVTELLDRVDDGGLEDLLRDVSVLRSELDGLLAAGAGVIAKRSEYGLGYAGLAQSRGHRSPVAMVQQITGTTRAEASRHVRLGNLMGEADAATRLAGTAFADATTDADPMTGDLHGRAAPLSEEMGPEVDADANAEAGADAGAHEGIGRSPDGTALGADPGAFPSVLPWYEPLTRAMREHRLKSESVALVTRILGEAAERAPAQTLRRAAEELVDTAGDAHVDELAKRARYLRDEIDPVGVGLRAEQRYAARSWRFGRNPKTGARTAQIEFDDESAAWVDSIVGAALRPRRGGPRFIDSDERAHAQNLIEDPRSNEQIVFDLLMDIIRTGVDVDPGLAYGTRQPGIRVVITQEQLDTRDKDGRIVGNGYLEETGETVPGATVERLICTHGTLPVTVDPDGHPLDVGREHRLFVPKQRIGLSIRDGGCRYPGCDRPPSYTEAHHINPWTSEHGRTDCADGILLCRHHHMLIHNNHWRVVRENSAYHLIPPPNIDPTRTPVPMPSRSPLNPAWRQAARPHNRAVVDERSDALERV